MDTLLFKNEHIKKLFNILNRLNRCVDKKYNGRCEREVFVRRSLNKWFKGKYLIWLCEDEMFGLYYNRYVHIKEVEFALNYSTELKISFFDYSRPMDFFNEIVLNHNTLLNLEGEWCKNAEKHNQILKLTVTDLPEKEYVFKAYDFSKWPKRKKKGVTDSDCYKLIKTTISFKATTIKDAYKQVKKHKGKLVIIPEILEIK